MIECSNRFKPVFGFSEVHIGGGEVEVGEQKLGFYDTGIGEVKQEIGGQIEIITFNSFLCSIHLIVDRDIPENAERCG